MGTGFSATVFERLDNGVGTGEYSLAIRGSQDAKDFLADTKLIATDGVAVSPRSGSDQRNDLIKKQ